MGDNTRVVISAYLDAFRGFGSHCECELCEAEADAFYELVKGDEFDDSGPDSLWNAAWNAWDDGGLEAARKVVRDRLNRPPPRNDPRQPKLCSFWPKKNGRARCWKCGNGVAH